jgi:hypothetical protein
VACLAWITIIVWGMILYVAGQVVSIIMDDFFRKCHLQFMTRDSSSLIFWGSLGCVWLVITSQLGLMWWTERISDVDDLDEADAMWWAYISILTVYVPFRVSHAFEHNAFIHLIIRTFVLVSGLGDYYLNPELIFFEDLFFWAFIFLIGFTCLSTFLNQMSELCRGVFPDSGEALKERLRNTNLVGLRAVLYKEKNEEALQSIGELVDKMDDDNVDQLLLRLTRIRQKKELLIHLLYQTQEELDYFKNRGEKYEEPPLPRVAEEENMLSEVLEKTVRERARLERYRDRVVQGDTELAVVTREGSSVEEKGIGLNKKKNLPFLLASLFTFFVLSSIPVARASPSSGFPGTIPAYPTQIGNPRSNNTVYSFSSSTSNSHNSSDDNGEGELEDADDESSSDWDDTLTAIGNDNQEAPPPALTHQTEVTQAHIEATERQEFKRQMNGWGDGTRSHSAGPTKPSDVHSPRGPSNKPLKTLEKLQQLLDKTDYMTTSSSAISSFQDESGSDSDYSGPSISRSSSIASFSALDPLWTSKDRSKYKKQQYFQEQQQRLQQQAQQQFSDVDDISDTDDGLGFTLPNLPVYLSDDEGDSVHSGPSTMSPFSQQQWSPQTKYPPLTSQRQQQAAASLAHQQFLQQQRDLYLAQQQYQHHLDAMQQQYSRYQQHYLPNEPMQETFRYPTSQYVYVPIHPPHYFVPPEQPPSPRSIDPVSQGTRNPNHISRPFPPASRSTTLSNQPHRESHKFRPAFPQEGPLTSSNIAGFDSLSSAVLNYPAQTSEPLQALQPTLMLCIWKALISVQRIAICAGLIALMCYAAVSPRSLHFVEYNQRFYENVKRAALVVLPSLCLYGWGVVDWSGGRGKLPSGEDVLASPTTREEHQGSNPIHILIRAMFHSFTVGYLTIFVLEIVLTTLLRLAVFAWWEPNLFASPSPPVTLVGAEKVALDMFPPPWLILPWVLRERKLRVKRITLLVADFLTSCVSSPIVEEVAKLMLLQRSVPLSK